VITTNGMHENCFEVSGITFHQVPQCLSGVILNRIEQWWSTIPPISTNRTNIFLSGDIKLGADIHVVVKHRYRVRLLYYPFDILNHFHAQICDHHCLRKVGRYQRYNQKSYIEEQTIQGLIGQTMIYKTLHRKDWEREVIRIRISKKNRQHNG
jgi:hypothetical protein